MKAALYESFEGPVEIRKVPDPATGNQQIRDFRFQPGFTHWGSYAEYVAINELP